MDQFFSGETEQTHNFPPQVSVVQGTHDDQFDFGSTEQATSGVTYQQSYNSQNSGNAYGSYGNIDMVDSLDNETTRKIRQEEQKIQQKLRQKSAAQFQLKKKRKEQGQRQLQEFNQKKQRQLVARRAENKQRQAQKIKQYKKLSQEAGWKKVAANVGLKQGENKTKRDTNRMREAIINIRQDQ